MYNVLQQAGTRVARVSSMPNLNWEFILIDDPNEAPALWDRMSASNQGGIPTFLSTHPNPKDRARRLRELLPAALEIHRNAPARYLSSPLPAL